MNRDFSNLRGRVQNFSGRRIALAPGIARTTFVDPRELPATKETWELPLGDRDSFYVNLNGQLSLWGKPGGTRVKTAAAADSAILGRRLSLLEVEGVADAPTTGEMTVSLQLKVLDNSFSVMDEKWEAYAEFPSGSPGIKEHPVEYSYKTNFSLGPIPMSVEVGARGNAGVKYRGVVSPAGAVMLLTPFVRTSAFVEVGAVDIEVGEVGVGGELVLVNDDLQLKASALLQVDSNERPIFVQDYSAHNRMEMLSGKLYIYAEVYSCDWSGCGGRHNQQYRQTLWRGEGVKTSDYLFQQTKTAPLQ
jgi:hypothetical protein